MDEKETKYTFGKPINKFELEEIIRKTNIATKSHAQYSLGEVKEINSEGKEHNYFNQPGGIFRKDDMSASIDFFIEEIEAEHGILFKSIEFSKHDLQDFDSAGNLSNYVRELIKSIDVAYNCGKVFA